MAKKKTTTQEEHGHAVTLKVVLGPKEHKKVKMAAAEMEITIAEFLHDAAVKYADQAVAKYYQRELDPRRSRRPSTEDK